MADFKEMITTGIDLKLPSLETKALILRAKNEFSKHRFSYLGVPEDTKGSIPLYSFDDNNMDSFTYECHVLNNHKTFIVLMYGGNSLYLYDPITKLKEVTDDILLEKLLC